MPRLVGFHESRRFYFRMATKQITDSECREKLMRFYGERMIGPAARSLTLPQVARGALDKAGIRHDGQSDVYAGERFFQWALGQFRRDALAEQEHPFAYCMSNIAPKANVSDPEAFCASMVHKATGEWPGKKAK